MRQCPRFHGLGPFSGDQSEKTIYARISGSISEHCWWQSLRMLPSFIVVRVKGNFFKYNSQIFSSYVTTSRKPVYASETESLQFVYKSVKLSFCRQQATS